MPVTSDLAVLFADIAGSTRLYETLGDERAFAAVGGSVARMGEACRTFHGRVVKTIGDEVMSVFATADAAAQAAIAMQSRLALDRDAPLRVGIRIGFHFGPAIERDGDVFGDSVNVAARLVGLANASQVMTSKATAAALAPWLRARVRGLGALAVKGKHDDLDVCELIWQDTNDDLTTLSTRIEVPRTRLAVRHGGTERVLDEMRRTLAFGRDAQNDVVIADRLASRMHAHVEKRREHFVLVDHSSNGTYVTREGEPEIVLRREEFVLRGRGRISFGHAYATDPSESVEFDAGP
ncbi:MAG TPA: adenylate/guanylate cyclase domain-containing protein [Casimicrobiaceae bacterium]|nr:adenylate/guanylate cyclase domain-containing protein [Casimicrobiaceae bacterium]